MTVQPGLTSILVMTYSELWDDTAMEGTELLAALGEYDESALDLHNDCLAFAAHANENNLEHIDMSTESAIRSFGQLVEAIDEHVENGAERLSMLSSLMLLQERQRVYHLTRLSGNPDIATFDKYHKQGLHHHLIYMATHAPSETEFKHQLRELYGDVLCEQIEDFTVQARENYGTPSYYFVTYAKKIGLSALHGFWEGLKYCNPWTPLPYTQQFKRRRSAEGTEEQTP